MPLSLELWTLQDDDARFSNTLFRRPISTWPAPVRTTRREFGNNSDMTGYFVVSCLSCELGITREEEQPETSE